MPKLELRSNAKPSTFAYVPALEEKKDKKGEKVETAVLSTTAKAKKKEADKKKVEMMEVVSIELYTPTWHKSTLIFFLSFFENICINKVKGYQYFVYQIVNLIKSIIYFANKLVIAKCK